MRRMTTGLILSLSALVAAGCPPGAPSGEGDSTPAFRLGPETAVGYREVVPGFSLPNGLPKGQRHAFATKGRDSSTNNAAIELLREEGEPIVVADRGELLSVRPSPAEPARAVLLNTVSEDSVGTLLMVDDLTGEPEVRNIPQGTQVPTEGVWWGKNGNELLFVNAYDAAQDRGSLYWSDTNTSSIVAEQVSPRAVIPAPGSGKAVVGHDISSEGIGQLSVVDLSNGSATPVAEGVRLFEGRIRSFVVSEDGSTVVFFNTEGQLIKKGLDSGTEEILSTAGGLLPAVSRGGESTAFFVDGLVFVASAGSSGVVELGEVDQASVRAVFSDDGQWIFWCKNRGGGAGPVGTGMMAKVDGSVPAVEVGKDVACDKPFFLDHDTYAILGDLNFLGTADYGGIAKLKRGKLGSTPSEAAGGLRTNGIWQTSGMGLLFVGRHEQGNFFGDISFLPHDSPDSKKLQDKVDRGTVRLSPSRNRAAFLADLNTIDEGEVGTLYATTTLDGEVSAKKLSRTSGKVKAELFFTERVGIGSDSRIVAVSAPEGIVWSFPAP